MNIGTQTSSLVNHLYSRMTIGEPEPTVGMGVTMLSWSDRNACLLYTSPSPRDRQKSRMPSSA